MATASCGFSGHLAHHFVPLLPPPRMPKEGLLLPHTHRLFTTSTAPCSFSRHLEHQTAPFLA